MIISIMTASGSALPSEQFPKKARPRLDPALRFAVENATKLRTRGVFPRGRIGTRAGNMPRRRRFCQRGGPLTSIARRSDHRAAMAQRRARFWNPALPEAFQNGFHVDCGVNLR
jgi:hypothetical protein